jgi:hypothetical protein
MVLKIDFLNKTFSQMEHLNGRSPEWIFWCFFNTFYVFLFFCFFKNICTTNITCESSQPCMRVHMLMKSVNRGWYFVTNITSKFFHFTWVQLCCTSILFLHDTQSYSKGWFSVLFNIAHQTIKVPVHIYISEIFATLYESGTHHYQLRLTKVYKFHIFLQWWDSPQFSETSSGLIKINSYKYPCNIS